MMNSTIALIVAGCIGMCVSVVHGYLTHKLMVRPILAGTTLPSSTQRLIPMLMHFSTLCWFFGGLALIAAPFYLSVSSQLTAAAFVGAFYLVGAIGNLWCTRGRHPGWVLLAVACALIVYGASGLI